MLEVYVGRPDPWSPCSGYSRTSSWSQLFWCCWQVSVFVPGSHVKRAGLEEEALAKLLEPFYDELGTGVFDRRLVLASMVRFVDSDAGRRLQHSLRATRVVIMGDEPLAIRFTLDLSQASEEALPAAPPVARASLGLHDSDDTSVEVASPLHRMPPVASTELSRRELRVNQALTSSRTPALAGGAQL